MPLDETRNLTIEFVRVTSPPTALNIVAKGNSKQNNYVNNKILIFLFLTGCFVTLATDDDKVIIW